MTDQPVTLAVVTGAHGVAGEVRLKFFTDDLTPYRSFNDGALTLKSLRGQIARFAEVADRNAAEALRGTALTVPRALLPPLGEGEYYHADLIDQPCFVDGAEIGRVFAIDNFGAGDVIEVERPTGKRFMLPIHAVTIEPDRLILDPVFVEA
jgi:16S rRNA processing protein RimM